MAQAPAEEFQVQAPAAPPATEGSMTDQRHRLVLDFRTGELVIRCLYRQSTDSPGPSTKARRRDVEDLVRIGLERALEGLAGAEQLYTRTGHAMRPPKASPADLVPTHEDQQRVAEELQRKDLARRSFFRGDGVRRQAGRKVS